MGHESLPAIFPLGSIYFTVLLGFHLAVATAEFGDVSRVLYGARHATLLEPGIDFTPRSGRATG